MSLSIAIISSDMEYARRLLSFVKDNSAYRAWRFHLFSNAHIFIEQGNFQLFDGVLIESVIFDSIVDTQLSKLPYFLLVEEPNSNQSNHAIYKYQPIPVLLHQLQLCIYERSGTIEKTNKLSGTELIGISSSLARSGKTVFAIHLCAALGARNHRVFYLNLELWNCSEIILSTNNLPSSAQSYSDFLYLVKTQPEQAGAWLNKHAYYDEYLKFDRLLPFQHSADRVQLSAEDALLILNVIKGSKRYDFIVVDLEEGMSEWNLSILAAMNTHFQISLAEVVWLEKQQQALQCSQATYGGLYEQAMQGAISIVRETSQQRAAPLSGIATEISLPYIEQWENRRVRILESAQYRAAIERCTALLARDEVVLR